MKDFSIFVNTSPWKSFKRFVWKLDENYLLRLGGIQLIMDHDQKLSINPVYYPMFSYTSGSGAMELSIYHGKHRLVFLLNKGNLYIFRDALATQDEER